MIEVEKAWLDWSAIASGVGGIFTAVGAGVAAWQLWHMKGQSTTNFEDELVREYRALADSLPLNALLGGELSETEYQAKLDKFYRYFDLCNQQIFLHRNGRISKKTWVLWEDGIKSNLKRPAFARAWGEIADRATGDFDELRALCPPGQPKCMKEQA